MQSAIAHRHTIHPRVVVILEDDRRIANVIRMQLGAFGFEPRHVTDQKEVLDIAYGEDGVSFILDVEINKKKVGLNVLEDIKAHKPQAFVCIYSSYINEEPYRSWADRLNADFILNKTTDEKRDMYQIARALLQHEKMLISKDIEFIEMELNDESESTIGASIGQHGSNLLVVQSLDSQTKNVQPTVDQNIAEYERLAAQKEWRQKHSGAYVGIVNGILRVVDKDPAVVLAELRHLYPAEHRFIKLVSMDEDDIMDMPSPLSIE